MNYRNGQNDPEPRQNNSFCDKDHRSDKKSYCRCCSQIPKDLLCLMNAGTDRAVLSRTVMIFLSGNIKKRSKGYKYKKNTCNRCHTFFLSCIHLLLLSQISSVNKFYLFFLTAFTADSVKHGTMRIHLKIMMLLHMLF